MHNILNKLGFSAVQGAGSKGVIRKSDRSSKNQTRGGVKWGLGLGALLMLGSATTAVAQDMPPMMMMMPPPPPSTPAMAGPLVVNPNPLTLDLGPLGEKVYITGAVTGFAYAEDQSTKSTFADDNSGGFDLANAQVFIQKTDGVFQYFIQAGAYSVPNLGFPYLKSSVAMNQLWGVVPQAFIKLALADNFSIQAGKLPTLIGDEYTFTFENMNILRGLLWDEEPAVSRGVQVNFSAGPVSISASWNDGYYSNNFNWLSGLVSWTIDMENTLAFAAGGNLGHTGFSGSATPFLQNNSSIFNIIYTHSAGPLVISPYFQYQHVSKDLAHGLPEDADSWGGAVLASWSFNDNFKLAGRVEYMSTSGNIVSFLYGPGSNAWSFTITPTYQYHQFFARLEYAYVGASSVTAGSGIGPSGKATSQSRGMFETGILF